MLVIRQQAAPAYWQGASVVCIDAYPAQLNTPVWDAVLLQCCRSGASSRLVLTSGQPTLSMRLILYAAAADGAALEEEMTRLTDCVVAELLKGGFAAHAAEAEAECLLPWDPQAVSAVFVPRETEGAAYVPGDWRQVGGIALERVARTLAEHPGCSWSLALMQASPTVAERECIRQNVDFFSRRGAYAEAEAYRALPLAARQPCCFAYLHVTGREEALNALSTLHGEQGLACCRLGASPVRTLPELLTAPVTMAERIVLGGHSSRLAQQLSPALNRLTFLTSQECARKLPVFPEEGAKLPGMPIAVHAENPPLPAAMLEDKGLLLGHCQETGVPVYLPPRQLTKHAVVVGMPGSGKTQFSIGMLMELHRHGYPFLAIEPTKTEYRALMDVIPELRVYTPGRSDVSPMALNPFRPPRGITLEEFLPTLTTVFTAAFSMPQPLDTIFADVLRACYTRYGWRTTSTVDDPNVEVFGLHEFICMFRQTIQQSGYSEESKQNLLSGGVYRLQALINSNPTLFDAVDALPYETLLEQPTLIELDAIDNSAQKSLVMAILLANMMLVVRHRQVCDGELKNVLMIDEAHLLLGQGGGHRADGGADPRAATVQLLQDITVAIRAYGTGVIFADQSPEKLTHEVVDNANIKLIFRLDSTEQRMMIGSSVGLAREDLEVIRSQKPGEAYCHCNLLDHPLRIRTVNAGKVYGLRDRVAPEEVAARMRDHGGLKPPFAQCSGCTVCDPATRAEADYLARVICDENQTVIASRDSLLRFLAMGMAMQVRRTVEKRASGDFDRERLPACVRAHLLRRIMLTGPADLPVREIMKAADKTAAEA